MKLSKVTWLFLIVGVLLIAGVSLGMTYSKQGDQQKVLEQQVAAARQKLSGIDNAELTSRQSKLIEDLSKVDSNLASIRVKLESSEDSISATEQLLRAAVDYEVQVVTLNSPGLSTANLVGAECDILSLDIQVDGDLLSVKEYVSALAGMFPTCIVKSIQMTSQPSVEDPSGELIASAKVNLVIYDYKGE